MRALGETVTVRSGAQLFVRMRGSGPPVYLLHGNFASSLLWAPQMDAFAEDYTVVAHDFRGFGHSPGASSREPAWVDLAGLMDALGHERAHIVGSSLGGSIALDFALAYPERVDSLVVHPGGIGGWEAPEWMIEGFHKFQAAADAGDYARARDIIIGFPPMKPLEAHPDVRRRIIEMFDDHPWGDTREGTDPAVDPPTIVRLPEIAARTLVISGSLDDPSFLALGDDMARVMPRAERVIIPDAGHVLNMERPDEFNRVVLDFLTRA